MKITQIRNATVLLEVGDHRLLVDPMLSEPGTMLSFRVRGERRRNPLTPLPPDTEALLDTVTAVLLTHEHPDHFDRAARAWVAERGLPVWANKTDAAHLERKGLSVRRLEDGALGARLEVVPSRHGRGVVGWLMGPVAGYWMQFPGEPSLYLTGDAILTESVRDAVSRLQPDIVVAPAGAANAGVGGDILFSVDELVQLAQLSEGQLVFNHLEALDHCPTTRVDLRARLQREGLASRTHVPEDGQTLSFSSAEEQPQREPRVHPPASTLQKWVTSPFVVV